MAGITRDSVPETGANASGGPVREEHGSLWDELLAGVKSGQVSEAFACGTAAVITGIESFVHRRRKPEPKVGSGQLRSRLRHKLLNDARLSANTGLVHSRSNLVWLSLLDRLGPRIPPIAARVRLEDHPSPEHQPFWLT